MILLNPSVLFSLVWLTVLLVSPLSSLDFYPYSNFFYGYLLSAVLVFVTSVALSKLIFPYTFPIRWFSALRAGLSFKWSGRATINLYIVVMVFSLILQSYDRALVVGENWWAPENIVLFRYVVFEEQYGINFPFVSLLNFFFFSAIPMLLIYWSDSSRWQRVIVFLLLCYFIYLSSARASIFTIALISYFFDWQLHGFRLKLSAFIFLTLVGFYYAIGVMTGKDAYELETFTIENYALGPSHALDQILSGERHDVPTNVYIFPFLHGGLSAIGVIGSQTPNLPFYYTPHPTNVYTVFGPYVLDVGVVGSLVCILVIGFLSGSVYYASRAIRNDYYVTFLLSIVLTLICLSVFHDYFTSAGYVWLSVALGFFFFPSSNQKRPASVLGTRHFQPA